MLLVTLACQGENERPALGIGDQMANVQTLAECFAHFGAVCASRRFSKSAVTQDGQTVVVAMWEDEVQRDGDRVVYRIAVQA